MTSQHPLRVLILCTGNSARSQMAEALLSVRAHGRVVAASAGVEPASRVSRDAVAVLAENGIDWSHCQPKAIDAVAGDGWDVVLTVCDHAREVCPVIPGAGMHVHWGLPDPAGIEPTEARLAAFRQIHAVLAARIDAFLSLPLETMSPAGLERALRELAEAQ